MVMNTNGDTNAYVKYSGGNIVIGAGGADKVTVAPNSTTLTSDLLLTNNDINAGGGYLQSFTLYGVDVLQSTFRLMSSSMLTGSPGTSSGLRIFTRVPMCRSGSIRGLALSTENATVKSGSLSGTVNVNGTPQAATVGMHTGTIAYATWAKDTYTFNAGQYLTVQLTASSGYLTDTDLTSGSFVGILTVEF